MDTTRESFKVGEFKKFLHCPLMVPFYILPLTPSYIYTSYTIIYEFVSKSVCFVVVSSCSCTVQCNRERENTGSE